MTVAHTERSPAAEGAVAPDQIAFLTGCGRSGTTILGTVLGQRPEVCFVNDRFRLWTEPFPAADIWSRRPEPARVVLGPADATAEGRRALLSRLERLRGSASVVVEKLAINNFRLPFLRALAPEARFINIRRHGVEVARSIARKAAAGEWYGAKDRKWALLVQHAEQVGLGELAADCRTFYDRGLLEWRMSVESAQPELDAMAPDQVISVTYEDLLANPAATVRRIERFLDLPPNEPAIRWARWNLSRQHPAAMEAPIPASTERIAGATLRRFGYTF